MFEKRTSKVFRSVALFWVKQNEPRTGGTVEESGLVYDKEITELPVFDPIERTRPRKREGAGWNRELLKTWSS